MATPLSRRPEPGDESSQAVPVRSAAGEFLLPATRLGVAAQAVATLGILTGLWVALSPLFITLQHGGSNANIANLRVDVPKPASPGVEAVAYFMVSEAITNVVKHAQATRAEVTVTRAGDILRIAVTDDGRGGAVPGAGDGTGLRGLAQRAAAVDGTLIIESPPGGPTVITAELPCES